jgi:hypothetical protein
MTVKPLVRHTSYLGIVCCAPWTKLLPQQRGRSHEIAISLANKR